MSAYTCQICSKTLTRKDNLDRHVKGRHTEKDDESDPENDGHYTNKIEWCDYGNVSCNKCGQGFGNQEILDH